MQHTLSVLVQNEAGVLSSLSGLFSGNRHPLLCRTPAEPAASGRQQHRQLRHRASRPRLLEPDRGQNPRPDLCRSAGDAPCRRGSRISEAFTESAFLSLPQRNPPGEAHEP